MDVLAADLELRQGVLALAYGVARMHWTKFQQLMLSVIILLLAACGARAMVLAKEELWSGLGMADWTSDNLTGDE